MSSCEVDASQSTAHRLLEFTAPIPVKPLPRPCPKRRLKLLTNPSEYHAEEPKTERVTAEEFSYDYRDLTLG